MSIFAVVLIEPNDQVAQLIKDRYPNPNHHQYNPTFYLINTDAIAQAVAENVGVKGENRIENASGFVIKLGAFSYSGYTARSLWDWLGSVEDRT